MSGFEARYDQIEDYLKGKLSAPERKEFEQEIAQNEALREEVAIQKVGFDVLEMDYIADVSQLIKNQTAKPKTRLWKWLGIGAIASLATVGVVLNGVNESKPSPKKEKLGSLDTLITTSSEETTEKTLIDIHKQPHQPYKTIETKPLEKTKENEKKEVKEKVSTNNQDNKQNILVVEEQKEQPKTIEKKIVFQQEAAVETKQNIDKPLCLNKPTVEVKTQEASADAENGRLLVMNKSNKVLLYKINEDEFTSSSVFNNLEGNKLYHVQVKDSDLCVYDFGDFKVEKSICESEKEYSFNMTYDTNWQLELPQDQNFQISIFNKLGKEVVSRVLKNEDLFEWNGYYDDNQKAALGIHVVYLKSQKGKMCKYNVVVSE